MPNHITNRLQIIGEIDKVNEVLKRINGEEGAIDFNKILTSPEDLNNLYIFPDRKNKGKERICRADDEGNLIPVSKSEVTRRERKYGFSSLDDWKNENWGTKRNAYYISDVDMSNPGEDGLVDGRIVFFTAWSTSYPVIEKLSSMFPHVKVIISWADEDFGCNVGTVNLAGGHIIEENIPEECSKEAYDIGFDLVPKNREWYNYDEEKGTYIFDPDACENYYEKLRAESL